jgi:predicted O-methyltransferase YrrM
MSHTLFKFINFKFRAKHKHGYGIHSPFAFDLVTNVIEGPSKYEEYEILDSFRKTLLHSKEVINDSTFGAVSKHPNKGLTKVNQLVRRSSINKKNGKLLFRLCRHFQPVVMLEFGTSIGLSSLYMAKGSPKGTLFTIEGNENKFNVARQNFEKWNCQNITYLLGKFDDVLPSLLKSIKSLDLVFFDGNHRKGPTLHYFELCIKLISDNSVFIFDDIHWSDEMEETWQIIKEHRQVRVTFDLFNLGLVFFRKGLQKQDYLINF